MALTVEQMSSLTAYVMAGKTAEDFISDAEIPTADEKEVQTYWTSMKHRFDAMAPGEQMMVPNEWS